MPLTQLLVAQTLLGFCQQDSKPCPTLHTSFFFGRVSVSLLSLLRGMPVIGSVPTLIQHDPILL